MYAFYFGVINMQHVLYSFYKKMNAKIIEVRIPGLQKCYVLGMDIERIWGKVLASEYSYFYILDHRRAASVGNTGFFSWPHSGQW